MTSKLQSAFAQPTLDGDVGVVAVPGVVGAGAAPVSAGAKRTVMCCVLPSFGCLPRGKGSRLPSVRRSARSLPLRTTTPNTTT